MIIEKHCRVCGILKLIAEFHPRVGASDGHRSECKFCRSTSGSLYRKNNKDRIKQKDAEYYRKKLSSIKLQRKEYYEENKAVISDKNKQYYLENKEKIDSYRKQWHIDNKEVIAEQKKESYELVRCEILLKRKKYYAENKERISAYLAEYVKLNAVRLRASKAAYRFANKGKLSVLRRKYEKRLISATPLWLNESDISEMEDFYTAAQMFKTYTGTEYHVDHIVPLQGKKVCGLHVPWNLQLLPWNENLSKSNKY